MAIGPAKRLTDAIRPWQDDPPQRDPAHSAKGAWALRNAPAYQHPRWVEFVETMPLAGTNKIDRGSLNKLARDLAARRGR